MDIQSGLDQWSARISNMLRGKSIRLYKLVAIILTVAMVGNYLARPQLAAAAESYGTLEGLALSVPYTYGEKVYAAGRLHSIAFCSPKGTGDAFGTASDVWFVKSDGLTLPTPFPVPLGNIGIKVGLISVTYGSTFDFQEIGYVANSMYGGNMKNDISGSYKIILDHCQDGDFNGNEDYIHAEDLKVRQSGQPDSRQIAAAAEIKGDWLVASRVWNAMSKVLTGVIGVAVVVVTVLNAYNRISGIATAWIGVGAFVLGNIAILFSDVAKKYEALAADPPDPQYKQYSALPGVLRLVPPTSDPLLESTIALATASANEGAVAEMLLHSLERYQGAQLEGRYDWQLVHARALRSQITLLQDQSARSSAAADELSAALAADTRDLDTVFATVEELRARVASSGLTPAERLALLGMGFSDEQVDGFVEEFTALSFDLSVSGIQSQLAELRAASAAQSAELDVWAAEIDAVIADLEADPFTGDPGPVARAGGSYTTQVGAPLTLSATASTSPVPITAYEWDLDGDGAFDDATGATPSVTFPKPTQQLIGLRTVNEYGLANVDFTALAVTPVNRSPRFDSVSASPEDFDLIVGETWPVTVTVSDPDGDSVDVEWLLDGNVVSGGLSYTYTPGGADIGLHTLQAVASNPGTSATPARHAWSFGVGGRDVDNDGWRSHLDCNDADPSVNPGMAEILGNGKDDDCDERTTDTGGPPVVFFNPSGGRNVALLEGGATIHSFSNQASTSTTPQTMINYVSTDSGWRTASGKNTNQWAIIALAGGKTYQIDRVKLMPGAGTEGVKTFSVAVSTSAPEGPYTTVFTGTAALNGALQEYALPEPVKAKYVKLTALTNQNGTACCLAVKQFKVFTSQEGERTVTFNNLTVDSDHDIVSWAWDFGDGTTSSEQQPTHVYPAVSNTYNVSLKVTDQGNNVVTYSLPYRVLLPPVASFTVTPASPLEGSSATYTDTSTDPDGEGMIATRTWYWTSASTQTLASPSTTHPYFNSGNVVVKLQVVDRQEQVTTLEKTVTIANVPPTVTPAVNQTIVWGQNMDVSAIIINDASDTDRGALVCDWNFGDGVAATITKCSSGTARVAHAYANPGSYTAALTVRDPDGGATPVSTLVTVLKRDTFVQVQKARNIAGGMLEVTAKAFDRYTWAPLAGRDITFTVGAASATAQTGADGAATVTLPRAADVDKVGASIAATSHYNGFGMERPIEAPLGDIVFVIDESGSMQDDQADLRRNLNSIAMQLAAKVDFQIGIVGFGAATSTHGTTINGQGHIHIPFSNDVGQVGREIGNLLANGGYEAGFDGTRVAMSDAMGFRPNAGTCEVLISDDWSDFGGQLPTTREDAVAALKSRNAIFLGIVHPGIRGVTDHYGMNPGSLAAETGGQVWHISDFREDPQPVLDAITAKCLSYITRVDLSLAVTDGRATAQAGDQLTYTLTVQNNSTGLAHNTALVDTLPANTSFVGASDGGTFAGGKVTWPTFNVAAGQTITRTLTIKLNGQLAAGTQVVNSATVADDGQSGPDKTPADNTAADTTTIESPQNSAPAVDAGGPYTVGEGGAVVLNAAGSDPENDLLAYAWDLDNNGSFETTGQSITFSAADLNGPTTRTVAVQVSDGQATATQQATVTISNVAPTADLSNDGPASEGGQVTVGFANQYDPSAADETSLHYVFACDGSTLDGVTYASASAQATATCAFDDGPASQIVRARVFDQDGGASEYTTTVELTNVAPTATLHFPDTITEEEAFMLELRDATDVSSADVAAGLRFAFDCGDGNGWSAFSSQSSLTCQATSSGILTVKGRVQDKDGGESEYSATMTANSLPPMVNAPAIAPSPSDEGQEVTASAGFTTRGTNNAPYTCAFDYGDGSSTVAGTVQGTTCVAPAHTYADNGAYPVKVTVTNARGASASSVATHIVNNVAPLVGAITAPAAPTSIGTAITVKANFSDPGVLDTHSAVWNWDDGSTQAGTINTASGEVTGSHTYTRAGVYAITLTVTDKDGGVGQAVSGYVVVYDANGGFVTGGGWVTSPAGAYLADQSAGGRANFGFNSKYKQDATPSGETEFQLKAGNLNFHSGTYEWLVVNGSQAQYKGVGTINGHSGYGFIVTVLDDQAGDKFRIKIWELATGTLIYDSQLGAPDSAMPTLPLGGGSITVHSH